MLSSPATESLFWLVVTSLAVWRISVMICYERGPFNLLTQLRRLLVRMSLDRLVTCYHCTAFWVSVIVVGILYGLRPLSIVIVFAASGAASIIERWLRGDSNFIEENANDE